MWVRGNDSWESVPMSTSSQRSSPMAACNLAPLYVLQGSLWSFVERTSSLARNVHYFICFFGSAWALSSSLPQHLFWGCFWLGFSFCSPSSEPCRGAVSWTQTAPLRALHICGVTAGTFPRKYYLVFWPISWFTPTKKQKGKCQHEGEGAGHGDKRMNTRLASQ